MRVAFRVDASTRIGTGHVMRCLTLATALRERGAECHFLHRRHPGHMAEMIRNHGFAAHELPQPKGPDPAEVGEADYAGWLGVESQRDAQETVKALGEQSVDWLVVDHYALGAEWERAVRPWAEGIAVLDDLADRAHDCDCLMDQTHGRRESEYRPLVPEHCEVLTGAQYALLRKEFIKMREEALGRRDESGFQLSRILVGMGGSDPGNVTERALQGIASTGLWCSVDVIIGGGAPHLEGLIERWGSGAGVDFYVDTPDVAQLMADADLGVGAGGTTSWERCCLGLPTLGVVVADNQKKIIESLASEGAVENLGEFDSDFPERVKQSLNSLSRDSERLGSMSRAARSVCDGQGAERVADRLAYSG